MANYLGVKCPVCDKRFSQADDVVVCPVCGAPHHRLCYKQNNECAFTRDHISGKEWRPPIEEAPPNQHGSENSQNIKACQRCDSHNPNQALFCQICGTSLAMGNSQYSPRGHGMSGTNTWQGGRQGNAPGFGTHTYNPTYRPQQNYSDPYAGVNKNETVGDINAMDIAMFVGPNHTYYLERFYQIEKQARNLQPNIAAAFLGFFFYFYRRMYSIAAITLTIFMLSAVPFFMFFWEVLPEALYQAGFTGPPDVVVDMHMAERYYGIWVMALLFSFTFNVVLSLFANKAYHRQVVTKIRQTKQAHRHTNEYQAFLPRVGGVDKLSVAVVGALLLIGFHAISSILLFSSNLL